MGNIKSPVTKGRTKGPLGAPKERNPIGSFKIGKKTKSRKMKEIIG